MELKYTNLKYRPKYLVSDMILKINIYLIVVV